MQTAQHTPGPWFVYDGDQFDLSRQFVIADEIGNTVIAAIDRTNETDESNARLLAAAPELLEALEAQTDAAQAVIDAWEQGDLAGAVNTLEGFIPAARAAIAEAKGGAS